LVQEVESEGGVLLLHSGPIGPGGEVGSPSLPGPIGSRGESVGAVYSFPSLTDRSRRGENERSVTLFLSSLLFVPEKMRNVVGPSRLQMC
jgi:hypothetical protein